MAAVLNNFFRALMLLMPTLAAADINVWMPVQGEETRTRLEALADNYRNATGRTENINWIDVEQGLTLDELRVAFEKRTPPDILYLSSSIAMQFAAADALNADIAGQVFQTRDVSDLAPSAAEQTLYETELKVVPVDADGLLLAYRKDHFESAGLEPPTSFEELAEAANTLTEGGISDIPFAVVGKDEGYHGWFLGATVEFISQIFGADPFRDRGEIQFDSDEFAKALSALRDLQEEPNRYPIGSFDEALALLIQGHASISIIGSWQLSEILSKDNAGITDASGLGFLASVPRSGDDHPVSWVETYVLAVPADARNADSARDFIAYLVGEGYGDWLARDGGRKLPVWNVGEVPAIASDLGPNFANVLIELDADLDDALESMLNGAASLWGSCSGDFLAARTLRNSPAVHRPVLVFMSGGGGSAEDVAEQIDEQVEDLITSGDIKLLRTGVPFSAPDYCDHGSASGGGSYSPAPEIIVSDQFPPITGGLRDPLVPSTPPFNAADDDAHCGATSVCAGTGAGPVMPSAPSVQTKAAMADNNRGYQPGTTKSGSSASMANRLSFATSIGLQYTGDKIRCSGTLISDAHILTAAHCLCEETPLNVFFGFSLYDDQIGNPGLRTSLPLKNAPKFYDKGYCPAYLKDKKVPQGRYIDIAVVEIAEELPEELGDAILPTDPVFGLNAPDSRFSTLYAVGFGEGSNVWHPGSKNYAILNFERRVCDDDDAADYGCIAGAESIASNPPADTCYGDSGGALFIQQEEGAQMVLIGVTSRSKTESEGCGEGGIYTSVENEEIRSWISKFIEQKED